MVFIDILHKNVLCQHVAEETKPSFHVFFSFAFDPINSFLPAADGLPCDIMLPFQHEFKSIFRSLVKQS